MRTGNQKRWSIPLSLALVLVLASTSVKGKALEGPGDPGGGGVPPAGADALCTYAIDPVSVLHGPIATDGVVTVTAPPGCEWTVDNLNDWVQIHFFTNGTGNGTVRYTVFDNPNPFPRSCFLTIGGQIFIIDQLAGPCTYSILPTNVLVGRSPASNSITVFTADSCSWMASATNDWVHITSTPSGTGNGVVSYAVDPSYSAIDRTTVLTVAGQPFSLTQLGTPCRYTVSPSNLVFGTGSSTGLVKVTTSNSCFWSISNTNSWFTLFPSNGTRTTNLSYVVTPNASSIPRTGVVFVAGQPIRLSQAGVPCTLALTPTNRVHGPGSETGLVSVASPAGCVWTALSTNSWISIIFPPLVSGGGTISYRVDANTGVTRTGFLLIGGAAFAISQAGPIPPSIVTAPLSQSVAETATATFQVNAGGTPPLSYRWQLNGVNLFDGSTVSGAATPTLLLPSVQASQAGNYAVVVSNVRGSITSSPPAILSVNVAPTLAPIPDKTVNLGAPLAFRAIAADSNVPAQALSFALIGAPPAGGALDPASGAFILSSAQGIGTYPLSIRVTDNGSPPLSATRSFSIKVVNASVSNFTLISTGSVWKYLDTGVDPGSAWASPAFNDGAWKSGPARLGYGIGNESTIVSYGGSSSSKFITTYFRRTFSIADPSIFTAVNLGVLRDHGAVVYLNGIEVDRENMPSGAVGYQTLAASSVPSTNQTTYFASAPINPGILTPGQNVIAVEIHLRSSSGSTMGFDLLMTGSQTLAVPVVVAQPQSQTVTEGSSPTLSVSAIGALPLSHQWFFNGSPLPGATNASLVFPNAVSSLSGPYFDLVANSLGSATSAVAVLTVHPNSPPVLAPLTNQTVPEGTLLKFTAQATDSDVPVQTLTFSLVPGAPSGASIDPATGVFSWTPTEAQGPSISLVTIRVTDSGSPAQSSFQSILVEVLEVNSPPVLSSIGSRTVNEGDLLTFTAHASDPDVPAQTWTFSLDAGAPTGASINPLTGVFTWTPTEAQGPSVTPITVRVTDSGSPPLSAFETITVTVNESNVAPVLALLANKIVVAGGSVAFTASATDADVPAQTLTYSLGAGAPSGATLNPATGAFSWSPPSSQGPSTNFITIRVTDNGSPALSDSKTFSVIVVPGFSTNLTFSSSGSIWKYRDTGQDLGTTWTARAFNDSLWNSGLSMLGYAGGSEATVVSYGPNSSAKYITTYFRRAFTVVDPSVLAPLNLQVRRDDGVVVYLNGVEVYRDNMPAGPVNYLTPAPLSVFGTDKTSFHAAPPISPALLVPGVNILAAEVHQHSASSTSMDFDLTLSTTATRPNNTAPILAAIGPKLGTGGTPFSFIASAIDTDVPAQTLTFSLDAGGPAGASINPSSGLFTWTAPQPGTYPVTVRVTDNGTPALSASETIAITINGASKLGLLVGSTNAPAGAQVLVPIQVYQFTNIASFQFSFHWDATFATFLAVEQPAFIGINLGTGDTNNGVLTVSWDDVSGLSETLADGTPFFAVRFQLSNIPGPNSAVWIDGAPTPIEAADGSLRVVPCATLAGQISQAGTTNGAGPLIIEDPRFPRLLGLALDSGGGVSVSWTALPGQTYQLQYLTNLSATGWTDLGEAVVANDFNASSTDLPGGGQQRFYRVVRLH